MLQRMIFVLAIVGSWFAWTSGCIRGNECRSAQDCQAGQTCLVGMCAANGESGGSKEPLPPETASQDAAEKRLELVREPAQEPKRDEAPQKEAKPEPRPEPQPEPRLEPAPEPLPEPEPIREPQPEPTPELDGGHHDGACVVADAGPFSGTTCPLPPEAGPDTPPPPKPKSPTTAWAIQAGSTGVDEIQAITRDASGNVYIAGSFEEIVTFGTFSRTSKGQGDVFVAKVDPQGKFLWVTQLGGARAETARGIVLDTAGNAYITGTFRSPSFAIGTNKLTFTGNQNAFVAKLDPQGKPLWGIATSNDAVKPQFSVEEPAKSLALAPKGELVIAGEFLGDTVTFATATKKIVLQRDGFRSSFIAALDPKSGKFLWATKLSAKKQGALQGQVSIYGLAVTASGSIYVGGTFAGDWVHKNKTYKSVNNDAFLAKLTDTGDLVWLEHIQGSKQEELIQLQLDPSGRSLLVMIQYNSDFFTLGGKRLPPAQRFDACLAKYDLATRRFVWVRTLQSTHNAIVYAQHTAAKGNIYHTGYFHGSLMCANGKHTQVKTPGGHEGFAVKWSPCGDPLWTLRFGSTGHDAGTAIFTGSKGEVYIGGNFEGSIDLKGTKLTSKGAKDFFLWKLKE